MVSDWTPQFQYFAFSYFNALYYLLKRHQALSKGELEALQRSWDVMAVCVTEVTLLRLFFAFLHTTPQLILQLCLFEQTKIKNLKFSEGTVYKLGFFK